jgi:hypothetical protein
MGVEVNYIYNRINSAISDSNADILDLQKSVLDIKNITVEDTSTVYGEISLLYDSSFVFTEPYKKVFRKVVSSYIPTVHEDAVNILSVDDIFPPNSRRRLENIDNSLKASTNAIRKPTQINESSSSRSPYIFTTSFFKKSAQKHETDIQISKFTANPSSKPKKYAQKIQSKKKRQLAETANIPVGNQIFFKVEDISQTFASAVALRIRDMESTFMAKFQSELKIAQLTEPARLSSQFGSTKISVLSGSGEPKSEVFVPELQQKNFW